MNPSNTTMPAKPAKDLAMKIGSLAGLAVILIGVVWVGVQGLQLFPAGRDIVANVFGGIQAFFTPRERIVVSVVDSQVVANEPFVLTWDHRAKQDEGSYTFSYECNEDVFLSLTKNGAPVTLFCEKDFEVAEDEHTLTLTPIGTVSGVTSLPVSLRFTKDGEENFSQEGTAVIAIQESRFDSATSTDTNNDSGSTATPSQPTTPSTTNSQPTRTTTIVTNTTPNLFGKPDLDVKVIAFGLVDKKTGDFEKKDELPRKFPSDKRAAIKFAIENIGTNTTGKEWRFEVKLPTTPSYTYESKDQPELFPGDKVEYIIGFDRVQNLNEVDYTIIADSDEDIKELNEKNNKEYGEVDVDK